MKTLGVLALVVAVVANFVLVGVLWLRPAPVAVVEPGGGAVEMASAASPVVSVEGGAAALESTGVERPGGGLEAKVAALEAEVAALRGQLAKLDVGAVLEEREALFSSEEGRAKADELFEMGQYATAAEGYLTFLRTFPDHPDAQVLLKKASRAFHKAGYQDKALWVWRDMIEAFPDDRGDNLASLARMELDAKRYDDAIAHATEAAELATTVDERYWRLLYRAWYVQERDGVPAGVDAYREVEASLLQEGLGETRMYARAVEKREELEKRVAASR